MTYLTCEEYSKHFLLRYSNKVHGIDVIGEHKRLIDKHGYVWFGKYGNKISKTKIESIIQEGGYIFLITKEKGEYLVQTTKILEFAQTKPSGKFFPVYYKEHLGDCCKTPRKSQKSELTMVLKGGPLIS